MLIIAGFLVQGGVFLIAPVPGALAPAATPTPNPLLEPTLPAGPSQADQGARVYWLSCMPCHGDQGQGLTEQFRQSAYPPEDQNCWNSGCHGKRPYQNGFTLPTTIPALVGQATMRKFDTAAKLQGFISVAMPFWKPGSLTGQESWEVTAFLLRQNGIRYSAPELNSSNASRILLDPVSQTPASSPLFPGAWIVPGIGALIVIFVVWRIRRNKPSP